jgi:hypothetical protein
MVTVETKAARGASSTLTRHLDAQVALLAGTVGAAPGVVSVVVLGSVARAEAVLARVDGRPELFSDVELLVVTRQRLAARQRAAMIAAVRQAADGFGYRSRRFHVDVLFRERRRLGRLPPIVFTFELRANGRTVFGRDVRAEIRPVTLANLDHANAHEILVKRLWHLAEDLPAAWLRGAALDELAARDLGVGLWRHPLDIPTALLPDAGVLLPTYRARVARWSADPAPAGRAALDAAVGGDSGAWLATCLARRATAAPSPDIAADHALAVRGLTGALAWLYDVSPADLGRAMAAAQRPVLGEGPISRGEWLALAKQTVQIARHQGAWSARSWLNQPRKGRLGAGLAALHTALVAHGAGDAPRAAAELAAAVAHGRAVGRSTALVPDPSADFATAWLAARAVLGRAFWRVARLGDPSGWPAIAGRLDLRMEEA